VATLYPLRKFSAYATECTSLAWISPISFIIRDVTIEGYFNTRYGKVWKMEWKTLVWYGMEDFRYGMELVHEKRKC